MMQSQLVIPEHIWSKKILQLPDKNREMYAKYFITLLKEKRRFGPFLSVLKKSDVIKLSKYKGNADNYIDALTLVKLLEVNTAYNEYFIVDWYLFYKLEFNL